MNEPNRRDFLAGASVALGMCATCAFAKDRKVSRDPVDAGPLAGYEADGITATWAESHGFFVVQSNGRVYAPSSNCSHKQALLEVEGDRFECPKHGSIFDLAGKALKAPASRGLPRLAVRVDERGHLIVDPGRQFDQKRWGEAGASVAAK